MGHVLRRVRAVESHASAWWEPWVEFVFPQPHRVGATQETTQETAQETPQNRILAMLRVQTTLTQRR
jgi:hypothetical protein